MAEAMCGPANPLQQFKQQTTLDRSLQQDRLTSRPSAAQGFRSTGPNAGMLNPEFEAFQAGVDINPLLPMHQPGNLGGPSQANSWASDFQRLNISSHPPFQQQQQPFAAAPETTSWAKNFLDQRAELIPRAQSVSPSPQAFQQRARYGMTGFQSSFGQPALAPSTQFAKGKAPVTEQFDEAAFERAFDLAREDMMAEVDQSTIYDASAMDSTATTTTEEPVLTGNLQEEGFDLRHSTTIHGPDIEYQPAPEVREVEKEMQKQHTDDDALAATASELLEKIEHNKTDKFKNSQFLGLMRKLRDREVRVEGDKVVETANATSSTTGLADATLNTTSSTPGVSHLPGERIGTYERFTPIDPVGHRPVRAEYKIPPNEQDYDSGRTVDPRDGQAVVDLLDQRGPLTDDMAYDPSFAETPYHGDS